MADEVVGEVRIDVHGNTEPLKDDIKRAARDVQKTISAEVASTKDTTVTDNIVGQVIDAEKPAGAEAQKVGRAIAKGVEVGSKDLDTRGRIAADLERAETPLRNAAERLGRSLGEATGRGMVDARREVAAKTSETVRVNVETNRDQFVTDLAATEQEWTEFGKRMNRSLEIAFMPWWEARKAMREDVRVEIEIDREKWRAALTDTEKDWFDFGQSMGKNLDEAMGPWWKHIGQSMKTWLTDDTGATQIGLRSGRRIGEGIAKGSSESGGKDKARQVMAGFSKNLLGAVAAGGLQATIYGIGARIAAVLSGGLLSQLITVGEGVVGWASAIVGQVGQTLIGVGAVVAGTIGTSFAGLGATAYSSIAAVLPAVIGLKAAFSGMEKEEKKAFEDRLKKATENLNGFGRAVREELLDPMFAGIKTFDKLVPTLEKFGKTLGKTAGDLITEFSKVFTSGPMVKQIGTFLQSSTGYLKQLGDAGIGLAAKIIPAFNAISPVTREFFTDVSKGLTAFGDMIGRLSKGGADSVLTKTLDEWYDRGKRVLDVFFTIGGSIAQVLNVGAQVRGDTFLTSLENTADKFEDFIDRIAANDVLNDKLKMWYDRGADLMSAFGNLTKIVLGFFDEAADAAGDAFGQFESTTKGWLDSFKAFRSSGDLGDMLKKWFNQGETLLSILGNLGQSVLGIFGLASESSGDFLTDFEKVTQKWEDWVESIEGEVTLRNYFEGAKEVLDEVWGLLGDIGGLFEETFTGDTTGLVDFVKMIRDDVIPAIDDFMGKLRDSGIQDALFNFAEAVGGLLESLGDSSTIGVFFDTLAGIVDVVADLLDVLGPILGPLATFLGYFKALQITKSAFSGLLALPALFKDLISPANDAKDAIGDLGESMGEAGEGLETGADGIKEQVDGAMLILAGFAALATATAEEFDDSSAHIAEWAADAEAGILSIEKAGEGIDQSFWEKWGPLRIVEGITGGGFGARNAGEEIAADLGSGFTQTMKRFTAGLGFDWGGIGESTDAVVAQFEAIESALMETGDVEAAKEALSDYQRFLEKGGVEAQFYADAMYDLNKAIDDVALAQAGIAANAGLDFTGDFSSTESALTSIGKSYDKNIKDKIDAIRRDDRFKDPITGGLTAEGIENISKLLADSFTGSVNGLDKALSKSDINKIKGILSDPKNFDKFGELGKDAMQEIADELPAALERNRKKVEARQKQLTTLIKLVPEEDVSSIQGQIDRFLDLREIGRAALKLYIPKNARADIDSDVAEIFGQEVFDLRAELKLKYPDVTDAELEQLLADRIPPLLLELETADAQTDMDEFAAQFNVPWDVQMRVTAPTAQFAQIEGHLMKLTEDGEWEAVIGLEADTIRAEKDIYTLTKGPDGQWEAHIMTEAEVAQAEKDLNNTARDRDSVTRVTVKYRYYDPVSGEYKWSSRYVSPGDDVTGGTGSRMVVPPAEGSSSPPSMISPGGPTTMGFMDSFTPFADQRANRVTGPGVMGKANYWSSDDPKAVKNITINNYYPEPERASDSIAMSLRAARYGG